MRITVGFDPTPIADRDGSICSRYGRQMNVLDATRHRERRVDDLHLIHGLGYKISRYYVDTELVHFGSRNNWDLIDPAMDFFQSLDYQPYFEFLHHILPTRMSYSDPDLHLKVEEFALAFAERYPWVNRYCIVNELLCSTFFSGMLGLWPPFHSSMRGFISMLLNAQRTNVHVSHALLKRNSSCEFLYPDTCEYHVPLTQASAQIAEFRNEMRFWGDDLIRGRVQEGHTLFAKMRELRMHVEPLDYFQNFEFNERIWVRGLNCYTHSLTMVFDGEQHFPSLDPLSFAQVAGQYKERYPKARFMLAETNLMGTANQRDAWWALVVNWAQEAGMEESCYWSAIDMCCWDRLCTDYNQVRVPTGLLELEDDPVHGFNWVRRDTKFSRKFSALSRGVFEPREWGIDYRGLSENPRLKPFLPYIWRMKGLGPVGLKEA